MTSDTTLHPPRTPDPMKNLERFTPYALAVLRVVLALLFMQHGLQKLLLFPAPSPHGTPGSWTIA